MTNIRYGIRSVCQKWSSLHSPPCTGWSLKNFNRKVTLLFLLCPCWPRGEISISGSVRVTLLNIFVLKHSSIFFDLVYFYISSEQTYLWQCRGNLRQYLTIVNQISKTSLSDSLTGSPTWIREMLAHLNSISWGIISECSVLDGLDWARSECRGAWELELLLLYVLVLKSVRYMGYKSGKWTPLNIYIIYDMQTSFISHITTQHSTAVFDIPKWKKV